MRFVKQSTHVAELSEPSLRITPMGDSANTSEATSPDSGDFSYRPFSKLAIIGLLLGLLSVVAFVSPVLWIVPLVAMGVSLAVWNRARRGEVAGLWLAIIGMVMAAFWGACAVGYHQVRLSTLKSSTQDYAQNWLQMVNDGNVDKAFQYSMATRGDTKLPAETYQEYYDDDPARREALDALLELAPMRDLVTHDGELVWQRSAVKHCGKITACVLHRFQFNYQAAGQPVQRPIAVYVLGELNKSKDTMEWFVLEVE